MVTCQGILLVEEDEKKEEIKYCPDDIKMSVTATQSDTIFKCLFKPS